MSTFYAVAKGKVPGIYTSWSDVQKNINGFKGPLFRKFSSKDEAQTFVNNHTNKTMSMLNFIERSDPEENDSCLICFTDGSCINNGKPNAISGYSVVWPYHSEYNSANLVNGNQTNNTGEYNGLIYAMQQADLLDPSRRKTLIVYSDSMLLIKSITEWIHGWKKNNWKKSDGQTISNLDLVIDIDNKMKERKLCMRHVKAHTGNSDWESKYNDMADKLARGCVMNKVKNN